MSNKKKSSTTSSSQPSKETPLDGRGSIVLGAETVSMTPDLAVPDAASFPFTKAAFTKEAKVNIVKVAKNYMEFDIIGVAPSIANAIRRTTIAEVPTMAIETVFVMNNTSIIPDEVLSHRLGLIPIYADPRKFDFPSEDPTDVTTIVFELRVACTLVKGSKADARPEEKYQNSSVYSKKLQWVPQGSQEEVFADQPIRPCQDDILITKLRPGQELDLELHCVKGIGKDHAKWSPVSCSSYRLLPKITIHEDIRGPDACKFAACFPEGVIGIKNVKGEAIAFVQDARKDTVSRECLRHPEFADKITLSRVHDHFICTFGSLIALIYVSGVVQTETVGFYNPQEVVRESLRILIEKCSTLKNSIIFMS